MSYLIVSMKLKSVAVWVFLFSVKQIFVHVRNLQRLYEVILSYSKHLNFSCGQLLLRLLFLHH